MNKWLESWVGRISNICDPYTVPSCLVSLLTKGTEFTCVSYDLDHVPDFFLFNDGKIIFGVALYAWYTAAFV